MDFGREMDIGTSEDQVCFAQNIRNLHQDQRRYSIPFLLFPLEDQNSCHCKPSPMRQLGMAKRLSPKEFLQPVILK